MSKPKEHFGLKSETGSGVLLELVSRLQSESGLEMLSEVASRMLSETDPGLQSESGLEVLSEVASRLLSETGPTAGVPDPEPALEPEPMSMSDTEIDPTEIDYNYYNSFYDYHIIKFISNKIRDLVNAKLAQEKEKTPCDQPGEDTTRCKLEMLADVATTVTEAEQALMETKQSLTESINFYSNHLRTGDELFIPQALTDELLKQFKADELLKQFNAGT